MSDGTYRIIEMQSGRARNLKTQAAKFVHHEIRRYSLDSTALPCGIPKRINLDNKTGFGLFEFYVIHN